MRTIRITLCRQVYAIQALIFMFVTMSTLRWYMFQPVVHVSKAVMTHQQEARASVLHYYNPSR